MPNQLPTWLFPRSANDAISWLKMLDKQTLAIGVVGTLFFGGTASAVLVVDRLRVFIEGPLNTDTNLVALSLTAIAFLILPGVLVFIAKTQNLLWSLVPFVAAVTMSAVYFSIYERACMMFSIWIVLPTCVLSGALGLASRKVRANISMRG